MKQKILLTLAAFAFFAHGYAQKNSRKTTAYAITGKEKGSSRWQEVKLVDVNTGEEIESIYESSADVPVVNARTGKPVAKKEIAKAPKELVILETDKKAINDVAPKVKNDMIVITIGDKDNVRTRVITNGTHELRRSVYTRIHQETSDKPFATNSAACAYDKKHDRLYYTPMGIAQLRYVDLKGKNTKVAYFEDEAFGVVAGRHDYSNQITRMVIAADGNGYALSNNAEHLIRFTTKKKAEITDLGALTDDAANGKNTVFSRAGYGGDMIAAKDGSLYLITANRRIFKIDVETKIATYKGTISGLPHGFSTNAAIVDEDNNIVVASANSTHGYFKFNMESLAAEKISTGDRVFNASDLANGNLLNTKKKKKDEEKPEEIKPVDEVVKEEVVESKPKPIENNLAYNISVFPNPVAEGGNVKISFADYPAGNYDLQLIDVNGKVLSTRTVNVNGKGQVTDFALPKFLAKGTYLVKVVGIDKKTLKVEQLVVQ
jgi:hypothetical protein